MTILHGGRRRRPPTRLLVWADDFTDLDASSWSLDTRVVNPNNEPQAYTSRPTNVRVEDSNLVLEMHREPWVGMAYTSGRVDTNDLHEFGPYGLIEARMKLPLAQGCWPAFWGLGANSGNIILEDGTSYWIGQGWPQCGEIDIMESYNSETRYSHGVIAPSGSGGYAFHSPVQRDEWHTYGVEWTPTEMQFQLDGITNWSFNIEGKPEFHLPYYLILNLALHPDYTGEVTPDSAQVLVDWVKVWAPPQDRVIRVPQSIALSHDAITVTAGVLRGGVVTANIMPAACHDTGTSWTTNDSSIALVSGGRITGVAVGTATITATTWNGLSASCVVTVT